jgi:hypothetical protein
MFAMSRQTGSRTAVILLLAATLAVCQARHESDPVILRAGKQTVRRSEFLRHLRMLETRGVQAVDPATRRAILDAFLEERLLVLEARTRGLLGPSGSPEDEQRAVQRLLYDAVLSNIAPTDAEVAAYYAAHAGDFATPETVTVRQILVPSENEARDIRRRVSRDPKNFEILARSLSRSPEAGQGGLLGTFARGELPPELEQAAFRLKPGLETEIVATPHGYHVLRVDAHTAAHDCPLDECREQVREALIRSEQDEAIRVFVRDLFSHAKVDYEAAQPPPTGR